MGKPGPDVGVDTSPAAGRGLADHVCAGLPEFNGWPAHKLHILRKFVRIA
jgi:hypothetical protein